MRGAGGAWLEEEMLEVGGRAWMLVGGRPWWEEMLEVGGSSTLLRWTMGGGLLLLPLLPFLSWRGAAEEEERRGG